MLFISESSHIYARKLKYTYNEQLRKLVMLAKICNNNKNKIKHAF